MGPPGGYGPPGGGGYAPPAGGPTDGYAPVPGAIPPGNYAAPAPAAKKGLDTSVIAALGCGGLLVLASIVGLMVWLLAGTGDSRPETTTSTAAPVPEPVPPPAPEEVWIQSTKPDLRFLKPPGWIQTESGRWGVFKSPDGNAVLAFVGFNRPNESTALIGEAARVLGVDRVVWKGTSSGTIGRDHFPARIGKGVCNFRGIGYISYATINPGGFDQFLVIYTVSADATDKHKAAVNISLGSLQRR